MLYTAIESGKWGYIDKNGEFLICPKYDFASEFATNRALVRIDEKTAVIDENGNEVLSVKNTPLSLSNDGKIIIEEKSTIWGPIKKNTLELSYITPYGEVAWKTEINMGNCHWDTEKTMYNWVKK